MEEKKKEISTLNEVTETKRPGFNNYKMMIKFTGPSILFVVDTTTPPVFKFLTSITEEARGYFSQIKFFYPEDQDLSDEYTSILIKT